MLKSNILTGLVGVLGFLGASSAQAHVGLLSHNGNVEMKCGTVETIEWTVLIAHTTLNWDLLYSVTGSGGPWIEIATDLPPGDTSVGAMHSYDWTVPDTPSGLVFVRVIMDNSGSNYEDKSNLRNSIIKLSTDLGFGKVGGNGLVPTLSACGDLGAGGAGGTLTLVDGPSSAVAFVIVSQQLNPAPFKGGTLAPLPPQQITGLSTDLNGEVVAGLPAGIGPLTVHLQFVLDDPGATVGTGLSNAITIDFP